MNAPPYWHIRGRETHAAMWWSHGLRHAHTYPAATQKGVADLCLSISYNVRANAYA